jgi:RHS repeat-associated protein
MKKLFFAAAAVATMIGSVVRGQTPCDAVTVPVKIFATGTYATESGTGSQTPWSLSITLNGAVPSTDAPNGSVNPSYSTVPVNATSGSTFVVNAKLIPGQVYAATLNAQDVHGSYYFVAPQGYVMSVNGQEQECVTYNSASPTNAATTETVSICIQPQALPAAPAGVATSVDSGQVLWRVSLGTLLNGVSAGYVTLTDIGTESTWSSVYTPAALQYMVPSTEIATPSYDSNRYLRQIIADQAIADIQTTSSTSYTISFYTPDQKSGTTKPYSFTGTPFVRYTVAQIAGTTGLSITQDYYDLATQALTSPTRTSVTTLKRTGSGNTSYVWTRDDWVKSGQPVVSEEVRTWGGTATDRTETISVGSAAYASKQLHTYNWGEELTSMTLGSSNPLQSNFAYYTTNTSAGNYALLQSISSADGSWTGYDYYDSGPSPANDLSWAGALKHVYKPFGTQPLPTFPLGATPPGISVAYTYSKDAFGVPTRPASIITAFTSSGSSTTTGETDYSYADLLAGASGNPTGMALLVTTATTKTSSSASLQTVTKSFREDVTDNFFTGQPFSVVQPDKTQQSFVYQRGSLSISGNTITFTPGSGNTGACSLVAVISGVAPGQSGTTYTNYNGFAIDPIVLVDKVSTLQVTYRNGLAQVAATQSCVWNASSSSWVAVSETQYTYDRLSNLISAATTDGGASSASYATSSASFSGGQKQYNVDATGVKTTYSYDSASRVYQATKVGQGGFSDLTTTYVYDAVNRTLSTTLSSPAAGETIVTSQTYDDAGRVTTSSVPGQSGAITTSYTYNVSARTRQGSLPNGMSTTETYNGDGTLYSVTGSVIPKYYTYTVNGDGTSQTMVNIGASNSPRYQTAVQDWAGRTIKKVHPGFGTNPTCVEVSNYDENGWLGHLTSTQPQALGSPTNTALAAATHYEYDSMGQLKRAGLDLGGTPTLTQTSADRITDTTQGFESYNGAWWLTKTTSVYPTASGGASVLISTHRQRLTGLGGTYTGAISIPGVVAAEEMDVDLHGNVVDKKTVVNSGAQTVTIATTATGVGNTATRTIVNGLETSVTGFDGVASGTGYDGLQRKASVHDPRTNTNSNVYYYSGSTLVRYMTDTAGNTVVTYGYDAVGRVVTTTDANGKVKRTEYTALNQVLHEWGDTVYPVEYAYDGTYGDRTAIKTYQGTAAWTGASWPSAPGTANWTVWVYDAATGLVKNKYDAANVDASGNPTGAGIGYTYNTLGQTLTRTWVRAISANYTYDANTSELLKIHYTDGSTPDVGYQYTRLGQIAQVQQYTNNTTTVIDSRTFTYDSVDPMQLNSVNLDAALAGSSGPTQSLYGGRVLSRQYDALFRPAGFTFGLAGSPAPAPELTQTYGFDATTGRFATVTTKNAALSNPIQIAYSYATNSSLLGTISTGTVSGTSVTGLPFTVNRTYDSQRNLLTGIDSLWSTTSQTRYDYTYNALAQRVTMKQSGAVFGDFYSGTTTATTYSYGYNDRGELTSGADYMGTDTTSANKVQLSDRNFFYGYDNIGNRQKASRNGSGDPTPDTYTTNAVNEYTQKTNSYGRAAGTVSANTTSVTVSGASQNWAVGKQARYWAADMGLSSSPAAVPLTIKATWAGGGTGGADLIYTDTSHTAYLPPSAQTLQYDADGNLISDGLWTYGYDAENRLVTMTTTSIAVTAGFPNQALTFKYDYLGRRVQKASTTNGTTYYRRFVYDGDNLIAEYDAPSGGAIGSLVRSYTWGLDLAGTLTSTGGVGALTLITDHGPTTTANYFPTFDGNGNIASLINASSGAVAATYEYSPFGEVLRCGGSYAKNNPLRYSTKYTDDETNLVYYGARFYSPSLGRFINRDSIAEIGGLNLYGFCGNDGANRLDRLGHWSSADFDPIHQNSLRRIFGGDVPWALVADHVTDISITQSIDMSFIHAMAISNQNHEEDLPLSIYATNMWVFTNMSLALSERALANSDSENSAEHNRDAQIYLGMALHTIQDFTSPSHYPFQMWLGDGHIIAAIAHIWGEKSDPGAGSALDQATAFAGGLFYGSELLSRDTVGILNSLVMGASPRHKDLPSFESALASLSAHAIGAINDKIQDVLGRVFDATLKHQNIYIYDIEGVPAYAYHDPASMYVLSQAFGEVAQMSGTTNGNGESVWNEALATVTMLHGAESDLINSTLTTPGGLLSAPQWRIKMEFLMGDYRLAIQDAITYEELQVKQKVESGKHR